MMRTQLLLTKRDSNGLQQDVVGHEDEEAKKANQDSQQIGPENSSDFTALASVKTSGNSLVYGIDVAEFPAYMLNYQHCYFYWTICAGKSA